MLRIRILLATLVALCSFAVTVAVAAPVSNDQLPSNSGALVKTTLQADLTLKSAFSPELLPATEAARPRHGFCRCSCGYACETSADCGGVSCDPFITCCVRAESAQSILPRGGRSTHAGEQPDIAVQCK